MGREASQVVVSLRNVKRVRNQYGVLGAVRQLILRKCPLHVSRVYRKLDRPQCRRVAGLSIHRYSQYAAIEGGTWSELLELSSRTLLTEIETLFQRGCELWLGRMDGKVAGLCWSRKGECRTDWFVPLAENDATILSCQVFPEYRGRGIYPAMLQMMVDGMIEEDDVRAVFIDCKSWNHASIRGIQKAGFSPLGSALRLAIFNRVWILWNRC